MEEKTTTQTRPHIAILQSPGIGHLIPLTELARQLVHQHNFSITLLIPTLDSPPKAQQNILTNLPKQINHVILPPIQSQNIPKETSPIGIVSFVIVRSLPHIEKEFGSNKFDALVVDIFGTDAFDVAKVFNVPCYVFYLGNALSLSLFWNLPVLDESVGCDLRDLVGPLRLPGCVPIEERDLMDAVKERESDSYKWIFHHTSRYRSAKGIIVNSFMGLEPGPIKALQEPCKPPIYPIGPLIRTASHDETDCSKWLDTQPKSSVLYISFGSGGTLNNAQFIELAHGLELSHQRFIWVIKSPNDFASSQYFTGQSSNDPLTYLPNGFMGRTKDFGLVVPYWAPQAQILAHVSIGGFMTHCGWNSILEGIVCGVPFIVWPLYAEQKMNALMLVDDLKIALRPKKDENGLVGREEIAKVVKELMRSEFEGFNPVRKRIGEMKNLAANALGENGESMKTFSELANNLRIC